MEQKMCFARGIEARQGIITATDWQTVECYKFVTNPPEARRLDYKADEPLERVRRFVRFRFEIPRSSHAVWNVMAVWIGGSRMRGEDSIKLRAHHK